MMRRFDAPQIVVAGSTFLIVGAVGAFIVRPFNVGMVGYDAAASVLYFERISEWRQLEAFVGATPKALLTGIYGIAFSIVPDWRVVSWLALMAYAAGISAAATLAYKLAGFAAAAFVAVCLVGSSALLKDVALASAVSWALLCWAACGLLLSTSRPHYTLAGLALAVGGLARFETLIIVGLAGALITLAERVLYPFYESAPRVWGLAPLADQQLGGLLMWVVGTIYLWVAASVVWFRWSAREESGDVERAVPLEAYGNATRPLPSPPVDAP